MTIKEARNEIVSYFNLEMNDYSEKKLKSILSSMERVIYRNEVVNKYVYVNVEKADAPINLEDEALKISTMYGVTVADMKGRVRKHTCVGARAHLVREMRLKNNVSSVRLAEFLNRDHSTIMHLSYHSKANCLVQPLYNKRVNAI
jgi:chromosomal replication initiation ATPase DnaA